MQAMHCGKDTSNADFATTSGVDWWLVGSSSSMSGTTGLVRARHTNHAGETFSEAFRSRILRHIL
jgi:hypothetical protein